LKSSPVLFQQRIEGPDIRVHVVDAKVFAEQIIAPVVDYRNARGKNSYAPATVPPEIAEACVQISKIANQPLMGIDFKVEHTSGKWYFLEANSMPCYQPYDKRAGGQISEAIAAYLSASR
jgi:glutathione synthase/RimK-type ligase-like ATP-grasp enzyme